MPFNEKKFAEVVAELAESCSCKGGYCFFRRLIETMHPDIRMLIQVQLIEKYKYEESERQGRDIGMHQAGLQWVDKGLAKKFADVYDESLTVREIYKRTLRD